MQTSYEGRRCGVCNCQLQARYFSLSKRSQTVTGGSPGVVMVSDDELVTDFCGPACRDHAEAAMRRHSPRPIRAPGKLPSVRSACDPSTGLSPMCPSA